MLEKFQIFVKAQFSAFLGGILDYCIMILLTEVGGLYYMVSIAIGCVIGSIINFTLNKSWAFYSKDLDYKLTLTQQLLRFGFVVISSISLKMLGTYLFTTLYHLDYRISRLIADGLVSIFFTYILQYFWVFTKKVKAMNMNE